MDKWIQPLPEHAVAYVDLCALVGRHADKVTAVEMLAIAANMIGKLIAIQDRTTMTPARAMEIVMANIEGGNREAIESMGPLATCDVAGSA